MKVILEIDKRYAKLEMKQEMKREMKLEMRDRLVELLSQKGFGVEGATIAADHLIENGVTFAEWISVSERKPELIPCNAGTEYSEAVNVLTSGRKVLTAVWDGVDFICPMDFWDAWGEEITHWTPVLLPLPEPPKGE